VVCESLKGACMQGKSRPGQGRAGQGRAGQGRAGQGRAEAGQGQGRGGAEAGQGHGNAIQCMATSQHEHPLGICAKAPWFGCEALASIVSSCWCRDLSVCSSAVVLASCASIACERACQKTQVSQIHILHV